MIMVTADMFTRLQLDLPLIDADRMMILLSGTAEDFLRCFSNEM